MADHMEPNDPVLQASIKLGEGCRLQAYPDPESPRAIQQALAPKLRKPGWITLSGNPWTIGWGSTGGDIHDGLNWTQAQADARLLEDLTQACDALDNGESWWRGMSIDRQRVLAEMAYNLGYRRLCGFHRMMADLQAGKYADAADEMVASLWDKEVGGRATRLADRMRVG